MKTKEKQRLVIDTNVWISYLIGKNTQQLEKIILDNKIKVFAKNVLRNSFLSPKTNEVKYHNVLIL
jgi:putative PIN family toxin of toxin-antitoxin system